MGRFFVMGILAALVATWQPLRAVAQSEQSGQLDLRDIDLDEPVLTTLLQPLLPPDGAHETVTFDRLYLDYRRSPEKLVIRGGAACHNLFAATIDGYADLPGGDLHFGGVIWPAYSTTPFGDAIPAGPRRLGFRGGVHGFFLSEQSDFTRVGLSYKVVGTRETPKLQINPFADVFPGALRYVAEVCRQPDAGGR